MIIDAWAQHPTLSYCQMLCMGLGGDLLFNDPIHKFYPADQLPESLGMESPFIEDYDLNSSGFNLNKDLRISGRSARIDC